MLGKLFKYEFKSTARYMLPTYLFILVLAFINMFFVGNIFDTAMSSGIFVNTFKTISFSLYYIAASTIFLITTIVIATKFYKNLLGNEGYISLTLPVSVDKHIMVKLITAFTWMVLGTIVLLLSILIVCARLISMDELIDFFVQIPNAYRMARLNYKSMGLSFDAYFITFALVIILCPIMSVLQIYFAMSIGQFSSKHKVGMAFAAYFVIGVVLWFLFVMFFAFAGENLLNLYGEIPITKYFLQIGLEILLFQIILILGYYFGTRYILKNKINLQ